MSFGSIAFTPVVKKLQERYEHDGKDLREILEKAVLLLTGDALL